MTKNINIGIVGLGYVGLPLFKNLSKYYNVYGIDINIDLIQKLQKNKNISNKLFSNYQVIKKCKVIIVTVPTPVIGKKPDLNNIQQAYKEIARYLSKNSTIVLESTVYPGVSEEYCVPILEKNSILKWKSEFNIGYSPERISPGETSKTLKNITKVISGDSKKTVKLMVDIYSKIVKKYYIASSIKTAEASKLLENTQRDANIALINEFKVVLSSAKINIYDVLDAAKTKWNFINLRPGLVGGHCIGVDPYYYLDFYKKYNKSLSIIEITRDTNESMVNYYFNSIINEIGKLKNIKKPKILILGAAFKKNVDDVRNSKSIEIIKKLINKYKNVNIFDPHVDLEKEINKKYKYDEKNNIKYDVLIKLVDHDSFKEMSKFEYIKLKLALEPTLGYKLL